MRKLVTTLVVFYQHAFSPDKGLLRGLYPFRGSCVMYPTCSEYLLLAIGKHGTIKGIFMGLMRIGRCHPFQKNLVDEP